MTDEQAGLLTKKGTDIPLEGVQVKGQITGRTARVKIAQRFRNHESSPVEAVYKFPLPETCALCGFRAVAGDRTFSGAIEERELAFRRYDEAIIDGDGAYLLDQERPNIFTLSIGNLDPGTTAVIELEYIEMLDTNEDEVRLVLPTTIAPRYVPPSSPAVDGIPAGHLVNPGFATSVPYGISIEMLICGKDRVSSVECPSHRTTTAFTDNDIMLSLAGGTTKMDRDFILTVKYDENFPLKAYWQEKDGEGFLQLDFSAPDSRGEQDARELIFLVDCSGSMNGSSIEQARNALKIFLKGLEPGTMFNILRFGSSHEQLFPGSKACSEETMQEASGYIGSTQANLGGTELLAPLQAVLAEKPACRAGRSIVVITDGEVSNEAEIMQLCSGRSDTTVFTVGIGHAANHHLVRGLARVSGGTSEAIAPGEKIEPHVLRLFHKVICGKVGEFKIDWGIGAEQSPSHPPIYRGETISVFARTSKGRGKIPGEVTVSCTLDGKNRQFSARVEKVDGQASSLPPAWARERIRELEDGPTVGSKQADRAAGKSREAAISISQKYGVICGHTSFIAIEKKTGDKKTRGDAVLRRVPVMLAKDWHGLNYSSSGAAIRYMKANLKAVGRHGFSLNSCDSAFPAPASIRGHMMPAMSANLPSAHSPDPENAVLQILASQDAGGGFTAGYELLSTLGMTKSQLAGLAASLTVKSACDREKVLLTAIVLAVLTARFYAHSRTWKGVTDKSRRWLDSAVKSAQPTIDGSKLLDWADNFARELSITV